MRVFTTSLLYQMPARVPRASWRGVLLEVSCSHRASERCRHAVVLFSKSFFWTQPHSLFAIIEDQSEPVLVNKEHTPHSHLNPFRLLMPNRLSFLTPLQSAFTLPETMARVLFIFLILRPRATILGKHISICYQFTASLWKFSGAESAKVHKTCFLTQA